MGDFVNQKFKFLFLTVAWGSKYITEFLEISLPTQLTNKNLLNDFFSESEYLILTDKLDIHLFEESAAIDHLKQHMTVSFFDISKIQYEDKYQRASLAQLEGIKLSDDFDYIFFIYPDFLCADGTLVNNAKTLVSGWDAIMCPVPPVLHSIIDDKEFSKYSKRNNGFTKTNIPCDKLVEISFEYFHPMMHGYNIDITNCTMREPVYVIRNIQRYGIIINAFHLHPIAIRVMKNNKNFKQNFKVSLDEEYITRLFMTKEKIYFPKSIEEFAYCSLRTPDSQPLPIVKPLELINISRWAELGASNLHREIFEETFYWGLDEDSVDFRENKERVINQQKELVERIKYRLNSGEILISYTDPLSFNNRKVRSERFKYFIKPSNLQI